MADASRTDTLATVAPQRDLLARPKSSPNQNQNSPSVSLQLSPLPTPSNTECLFMFENIHILKFNRLNLVILDYAVSFVNIMV
jgi:hypothetical protein